VSALLAPGGSVDWMYEPLFDSPSVFGSILGRRAGTFRVAPLDVMALPSRPVEAAGALDWWPGAHRRPGTSTPDRGRARTRCVSSTEVPGAGDRFTTLPAAAVDSVSSRTWAHDSTLYVAGSMGTLCPPSHPGGNFDPAAFRGRSGPVGEHLRPVVPSQRDDSLGVELG
jgi:hypothetical protein